MGKAMFAPVVEFDMNTPRLDLTPAFHLQRINSRITEVPKTEIHMLILQNSREQIYAHLSANI